MKAKDKIGIKIGCPWKDDNDDDDNDDNNA